VSVSRTEFAPLHKQQSDRTSLESVLVSIFPVYTTAIFKVKTPTALNLLASVTLCIRLSLGQLQAQNFQPVRIGVVFWGMVTPNTRSRGNVSFANVMPRYFLQHTGLTLVSLFNVEVVELQTSYAFVGTNFNS